LEQLSPDSLIPSLLRLPLNPVSSTNAELTILFLTTCIPLRHLGGQSIPTIPFPPYSKAQLVKILNRETPASVYWQSTRPEGSGDLEHSELVKIWQGLNEAVIDTFGPGTSLDPPTILSLSSKLWPEFVKPIIQEGKFDEENREIKFGTVNFAGLFAIGKGKKLFSGEEVLKNQSSLIPNTERIGISFRFQFMIGRFELPFYAKFLLISAYLASYNPVQYDIRLFSRDAPAKKRRRTAFKSNKGIAKVWTLENKLMVDVATINWTSAL
jgi:origin recognition complex subunit 5